MKLTLGHSDIIAGICMLLESKGMTAFSPEVVEASFSLSRKDGTLSVELDNDPAPKEETSAKAPAENKPAAKAQASASKGGENAAPEAKPNEEPAAEPEPEPEAATTVAEVDPAPAADAGDDDNLFG